MRFMPVVFVVVMLSSVVCHAQAQSSADNAPAEAAHDLNSYLVRITEFRLEDAPDFELQARDVVEALEELKKTDKLKLIETVQISALQSHESVAHFGRSVVVTIGNTSTQFGKQRSLQERKVGTQVQVTALPHDGNVLLKLTYESSRLGDNETEDSPPDTLSTQCKTTVLLEPGVPKLLSATSANDGTYLMVSITKR